jgi:hypothetical protein
MAVCPQYRRNYTKRNSLMCTGDGKESKTMVCRDSLLREAIAASDLVLCMCVITIMFLT